MSARARKGRAVAFARDDSAPQRGRPDNVTGLYFEITPRCGRSYVLDYRDLRPRGMALGFASAIRRMTELGGPIGARPTLAAYAATGRMFCSYLMEAVPHIRSPAALRAAHVDGFEAWMTAGGKTRVHLFTRLSKIIQLLRNIDEHGEPSISDDLRERLQFTSDQRFVRPTPRDAYSPYVARQLRDAARADIAAIIRRLDGAPVIPCSRDIRQYADPVIDIIRKRGVIGYLDPAYRQLASAIRRQGGAPGELLKELHSRFYLNIHDLPPMLALLSLETGLEIECVKSLKADCLSSISRGAANVAYKKRRAHGAAHKTIRVRDGGSTTPGGLVRTIIKLTERSRRFSPSDSLWSYYHAGEFKCGILHPKITVDAWVRRHNIVDDDGGPLHLTLSRLRKTHKALWYLKSEGHMARFAVGHTPEIAAAHYADIPALRHLHEEAVADAFSEAVASAGPTVLTRREERQRIKAAARLKTPHKKLAVLQGGQDVWLASCSGFTDSPFGAKGDPCPTPFWGCLECANAVITERKLPAILAFLDFIETQRAAMSAPDWAAKFSRAHQRITSQVLPSFDSGVIAAVRKETINAPVLYLPPEARQ